MADGTNRTEIFENMPVRAAVIKQIVPAIASQLMTLVYNLADTYFVGRLNNPNETAAITVAYSSFLMLTAVSNLFGVGGASAIARTLGRKEIQRAKQLSSIAFWFGLITAIVYSMVFAVFAHPILILCGATQETYDIVFGYAKWVIILGGPATVLNVLLANLVRSEGSAASAFVGVTFGGVLNVVFDPIFILPEFLGMGAAGAGIATALSNLAATMYFLGYILRKKGKTALSIHPKYLRSGKEQLKSILAVGLPSALQYGLTVVAVAAQSKFVSKYPTEAVAALGIAKKLDQLPLYFSIGTANGLMPFLAYNYSAGNQERRKKAFRFGCGISVFFALLCLVVYEIFAPQLTSVFIHDFVTINYGSAFLRCMVTAMPLMAFCYPMIIQFQAMGKVKAALICSILRKGVLDIPLLFLMDSIFPLYGCMWVQPIVDFISLLAAIGYYKKEKQKIS